MKLQVLVPHYKETPEEMEPLLDSLALQQSVDFSEVGVIIAYDGPEATMLYDPGLSPYPRLPEVDSTIPASRYPFEIKHVHMEEHRGVSACRNAALDAATADYVMFCDADDMFYTVNAVHTIFQLIENEKFETLVSCFVEEQKTEAVKDRLKAEQAKAGALSNPMALEQIENMPEFVYIPHEMDSTFVHGKVHSRSYLVNRGIRFNPKLTVHEDSYFNILAQNLGDPQKAKYCPTPFYLWKWRDASVCRHDPDYILKTYNNMLDSNDALVDEFVRRMLPEKAGFFAAFMIFDAYYTMNKPEWLDKTHEGYRDAVEKRFAEYFRKHRSKWDSLTGQEKTQISVGVRARSVGEGMLMEAVTIDQWLDKVQEMA